MRPYAPFVRLLRAFPPTDGVVELRAVAPRTERAIRAFFMPGETRAMTAWLARRGPYLHGFFGVAFRDGRGGTKRHLTALPAPWIDLDTPPFGPQPQEPRPSVIISSGRGEHWYWLLTEPVQVDTPDSQRAVESLLRGLANRFGADPSSTDVSHLLRVPGTINPKYDPPVLATVKRFDGSLRYHLADLLVYAGPMNESPPRLSPAKSNSRGAPLPPADAIPTMLAECGFLRWAKGTPAQVPEPLWYAAITNVSMFPASDLVIHALSEGHPRYSPGETRAKIAHARRFGRPHTCRTISALGATQCAGCPWAGRVRAPSGIPYKLARRTPGAVSTLTQEDSSYEPSAAC